MRTTIPGGPATPLARVLGAILPLLVVLVLGGAGAPPHPAPGTARGGGLEMALSIAAGPYFLGELLPARVTLTNHSSHTIWYLEWLGDLASIPFVKVRGGSAPYYYGVGIPMLHGVTGPYPQALLAGQTHTEQGMVTVQTSGHVTLTAIAYFYNRGLNSNGSFPPALHLFPPGAASLRLLVAPRPPRDRTLRLQRAGYQVRIFTPPGTQPHLLYQFSLTCGGPSPAPTTGDFTTLWGPVPANPLDPPTCGLSPRSWRIVVGAPGFAVTAATYTQYLWPEGVRWSPGSGLRSTSPYPAPPLARPAAR